jgi:hypothetical protein
MQYERPVEGEFKVSADDGEGRFTLGVFTAQQLDAVWETLVATHDKIKVEPA